MVGEIGVLRAGKPARHGRFAGWAKLMCHNEGASPGSMQKRFRLSCALQGGAGEFGSAHEIRSPLTVPKPCSRAPLERLPYWERVLT